MKVSVVCPVYNMVNYIEECVDSVLKQTYTDYELLIIDDCSTDGTWETLQSLAKGNRQIRLLRNNRHDYIATLNMCLDESKGEYIARIDSDDVMTSDRLEKQVHFMDANRGFTVCSSWMTFLGETMFVNKNHSGYVSNPYLRFVLSDFIANPTTLLRRSFIKQHDIRFQESYIYAEDYKFWVDVAKHGGRFYVIPECLTSYRWHSEQVSRVHASEQASTTLSIQNEILNDLLERYNSVIPEIQCLFQQLAIFNESNLLSAETIFRLAYEIIENRLRLDKKVVFNQSFSLLFNS